MKGLSIQNAGFLGSLQQQVSWDLNEDFTGCTTNQCDGLWASSDTTAISVVTASDWIHWIVSRGTNDHIAYDLLTNLSLNVSDTAWVLRQSTTWNSKYDVASNQQWFGMGSLNQTNAHNATWDFIGFMISLWAGSERLTSQEADGAGLPASGDFGSTNNFIKTLSTKYYFETIRLSATTYSIKADNNSDFSSTIIDSGTLTCVNTIVDTDFINMLNENAGSGSGSTDSDTDTTQFANGVTVAP